MPNDFESEFTIGEWQVTDVEGGLVNVGQSWQDGSQPGAHHGGGTGSASSACAANDARSPSELNRPRNLNELVLQVQWLSERIAVLERELAQHQATCLAPSKVDFKIQKLYVRELSGTLNIGVTSIGGGGPRWSAPEMDLAEGDDDWRRLEQEGDENWFTDANVDADGET